MNPTAERIGSLAVGIGLVALVFLLVRPGSGGPQLVAGIGNAYVNAARAVVGSTSSAPASVTLTVPETFTGNNPPPGSILA